MPNQCLASTGSNLLAVLGIGFVLAVIGCFLLRSAKGRVAVMVLVLVGGGLLVSQATVKPAAAACVASPTTTMPAPTTTSSTTTTTTTPTADFTFSFTFGGAGITDWNAYGCSNFTAAIKVTGASGPGTELANAFSSFPSTQFQSEPVPVTASTSYTVTYSWSCDPATPSNQFFWTDTTSNASGPVALGNLNTGGGNWSQTATFSTGSDVSDPIVLGLSFQGQSPI